jgi:hypothetical protein
MGRWLRLVAGCAGTSMQLEQLHFSHNCNATATQLELQ